MVRMQLEQLRFHITIFQNIIVVQHCQRLSTVVEVSPMVFGCKNYSYRLLRKVVLLGVLVRSEFALLVNCIILLNHCV